MQEEKSVLERTVDRRKFSLATAMAILGGVAITISEAACGGDSPSSPTPSATPPATDKVGTISSNHGHSAVITAARLSQGGDLNLDITGTSSHPHTVALSGADLTAIAGGQRVSKESSTDNSHSHTVTFN